MSNTRRVVYWMLTIFFILSAIGNTTRGGVLFLPALLVIITIASLIKDRRVRRLRRHTATPIPNGFIQIPILVLVVAGTIVVGGVSYVGVTRYQSYQSEKIEKERITQKKEAEKDQQIQELTKEIGTLKSNLTEIKNSEKNNSEIQAAQKNKDLILINYKIDVNDFKDLRIALAEATYNSPQQLCQSIVAEKTTRENIYYTVKDEITDLNNRYSKYRNDILYIDNNLYSWFNFLQITRDKCLSLGYPIE